VNRLGVGLSLHPDPEYLELTRDLLESEADYFEVNPETLWRTERGALVPNDFHRLFRDIQARSGKPFVAHGLGFSLGTPLDEDGGRLRADAWLERLRHDQETFRFEWLTEHLGWTTVDGLHATLPLPLPFTAESVEAVSARVRLLRAIVPDVGVENGADAFVLGNPGDAARFLNDVCASAPCRLLLDLHNLHTQCRNLGQDPRETLDRINLDAVLQIHLSGGSESDPGWLPSGRIFRLDSHDGAVPEVVWTLFERALPRCRNLRGVVVERLNGTLDPGDLPQLAGEVRRARELLRC
jgi:uncharacterized protein (UPF0276 family)